MTFKILINWGLPEAQAKYTLKMGKMMFKDNDANSSYEGEKLK